MRAKFGHAEWARSILRDIAEGVSALHEASVVHRDLEPGNCSSPPDRLVARISDFGISRFESRDDGEAVDATGATMIRPDALTATGALLGTPFYMAPEAARGFRSADAPADVFAFGILACELLTRRAPFAAPALYLAMAGERLPAPTVEGIPEDLRARLLACLAEDAGSRPSMQEIRKTLAV